jgi:hypothetical protein
VKSSFGSSRKKMIIDAAITRFLLTTLLLVSISDYQCFSDGFQPFSAFVTRGNFVRVRNMAFSTTTTTCLAMGMERIEFTIHPDGRVEELVVGVKGENCHKVNE